MRVWSVLLAAWGVALVSTLGALFIGEVMGMAPCLLCWYQRIFMFPLAIILGMAAFAEDRPGAVYALPLALVGTAVSGYHSALIAGWVPKWWVPCGTGPSCSQQSQEPHGPVPERRQACDPLRAVSPGLRRGGQAAGSGLEPGQVPNSAGGRAGRAGG